MKTYIDIVNRVLENGEEKVGRNGSTISISGETFRHDMRKGFPILTIREMSLRNAITETRFFIQGLTDKAWLKARGNNFWNKWCNRLSKEYQDNLSLSCMTPARAAEETNDLGPIYGAQWRNFNGVDQFRALLHTLRIAPESRRMLVSAWNPSEMASMALPPCHDSFQCISNGTHLDLIWRQRSCDVSVGLPYDILLYGLLLELIAKDVGMKPRWLVGQLGDTHIYEENKGQLLKVIARQPKILPELKLQHSEDIFTWAADDIASQTWVLSGYQSHLKEVFKVIA